MNLREVWASKRIDDAECDDFLKFDRVENKFSKRADLHAFTLLDALVPDSGDIVSAAEHDKIWIGVNLDELEKIITEDQVVDLIRCGVMLDAANDSLFMFA